MQLPKSIRQAAAQLRRAQIPVYAGNAAFFLVLSLLPLFTLLLAVLPKTILLPEDLFSLLRRVVPEEVLPLFEALWHQARAQGSAAVISLSALTAVWSASRGIYGIGRGLNAVLELPETRNYVRVRLVCALHMLLFVLGLVLTLLLHVFGQKLLALLSGWSPAGRLLLFLLEHLQLYSICFLTALFCLLFLALPNRRQSLSLVLPGAAASACAWLLFSALFSFYVSRFSGKPKLYGSFATLVLAMLWVYACVSILFYGAFLNRLLFSRRFPRP